MRSINSILFKIGWPASRTLFPFFVNGYHMLWNQSSMPFLYRQSWPLGLIVSITSDTFYLKQIVFAS